MKNARATILVVDAVPDSILVLRDVLASDHEILAANRGRPDLL